MSAITFICIIHSLGADNYEDKLYGKMLIDSLNSNEDLYLLVKIELENCLDQFNKRFGYQVSLNKLGILGVITDHNASIDDKEIFDIHIDYITNKFRFNYKEIDITQIKVCTEI